MIHHIMVSLSIYNSPIRVYTVGVLADSPYLRVVALPGLRGVCDR